MHIEKPLIPLAIDDVRNLLQAIDTIEKPCPNCGIYHRMPLVVTKLHADRYRAIISVIERYITRHPEIQDELIEDLINSLLKIIPKTPR